MPTTTTKKTFKITTAWQGRCRQCKQTVGTDRIAWYTPKNPKRDRLTCSACYTPTGREEAESTPIYQRDIPKPTPITEIQESTPVPTTAEVKVTPAPGTIGTAMPLQKATKKPSAELSPMEQAVESIVIRALDTHAPKTAVDKTEVEELIKKAVSEQEPKTLAIKVNEQEAVKIDGPRHAVFERVLKTALAGVPVLLVGPTGSGKSFMAKQVAQALNRDFGFCSCSGGTSESQLLGRLLPTGEGGKFEYHRSEFVKCFEEGGVFLIDEIDASDPNVLIVLNEAVGGTYLSVPYRTANPTAVRHPDFILLAAANTWGTGADRVYVGRNQLDGATINRFQMGTIEMDYDPKLEKALVPAAILTWGHSVRKTIKDNRLRRTLSTRDMQNAAKLAGAGLKAAEWKSHYFAGWSADEKAKCKGAA